MIASPGGENISVVLSDSYERMATVMVSKRDGLVPIGEVFSGLAGPLREALQISPQAMHHFTRFDQVDQLVGAS